MTGLTANIEGLTFQASCFEPEGKAKNVTLFCLPGGGASAKYFDLSENNSFAQLMSDKGYRVITMDHPGTGTNPLPADHPFLKPRQSADYIAACLDEWSDGKTIGIGHSMGGVTTTLVQARHQPFKAIGLFGSSAGGLDMGLNEHEQTYKEKPNEFERDLEALALGKFKVPFPPAMGGPSGRTIAFGGETPELTQRLRDTTCEMFAAGGMMSMTRGSFRKEVNAIDVPIFFAFGDHDIGIPPGDVPQDYINAPSTELVVLGNTGHNSFAFSSIGTLCERLDNWASNLD